MQKYYKLFFPLGALMLSAICAFAYQALKGLGVTGLREPVVWGLYVVNFTFFLGLGAGILILLVFISMRKEISSEFKFFSSIIALVSLSLAGIFILLDLGRIDRFYYMIIYAQLQSPLFWDFIVMNIFLAISFVFCVLELRQIFCKLELKERTSPIIKIIYKVVTFKKEFDISKLPLKIVNIFVLLLVIGLYLITTEIFVGSKAHPSWNSPFLSLTFLTSAILCGLSAMILSKSFFGDILRIKGESLFFPKLKKFLLFLLFVDSLAIITKYVFDSFNPLIESNYSLFPFSFFIFLIIGNILPILLVLAAKGKTRMLHRVVPSLILCGVLLKRANIIIPAYFQRWLPFSGQVSYSPTLPEVLIVLGVYSAGIIALVLISFFVRYCQEKSIC